MKAKNIFLFIISIVVFLTVNGCEKFLEIDSPKNEILTQVAFGDNVSANSAISAIYVQLANGVGVGGLSSYKFSFYSGILSDELKHYSPGDAEGAWYMNSITSQNYVTSQIWAGGYNYIFQANSIIENLVKAQGISENLRKQLQGEALFIRAFWHLYLTNLYGEIPVVTLTDYQINSTLIRKPLTEVYSQIVADLKQAETLLNTNFVGADGISVSAERVRPCRWAATALLSRVYLYLNDYKNAEELSSMIIDKNVMFSLEMDLNKTFLKNSKESIWQLQPSNSGFSFATSEGYNFILQYMPGSGDFQAVTLSSSLLNSFENNDMRNSLWVKSLQIGSEIYTYPFKYKVNSSAPSASPEYSVVMRLSEQYLIRAEARAKLEKLDLARQDLDAIRLKAGLPKIMATDQSSILQAIEKERRHELFTEWGHRWFDLKRTGRIDAVMKETEVEKGSIWNTDAQLLPLPQKEIETNTRLKQNKGYN